MVEDAAEVEIVARAMVATFAPQGFPANLNWFDALSLETRLKALKQARAALRALSEHRKAKAVAGERGKWAG